MRMRMPSRTEPVAGVGPAPAGVPRPATRQGTARLGDARLLGGVALVVVSALLGALLLTQDQDAVTVLRATRDLAAGATVSDAEPVQLPRSAVADAYLSAAESPTGSLMRPIRAGELIPRAALTTNAPPMRGVTVPVDPLHAPPSLLPGDAVDVWASAEGDGLAVPTLVLAHAVVSGVADVDVGLGGEIGVVLEVAPDRVADVVAATRAGAVDLVAVPLGSDAASAGVPS